MKVDLFRKIANIIKNIFANKAICIIGIDGTGKTSITNELKFVLKKDTVIQYMGHHENKYDIRYRVNKLYGILILFSHLWEAWYKVTRHWPHDYIVIYDRYAWDKYINRQGLTRFAIKLLFRTLFPKPRHVFYLYCPSEHSLERKNDILDPNQFVSLKAKYDREFLCNKEIISIITEINDIKQTVNIIRSYLPECYF